MYLIFAIELRKEMAEKNNFFYSIEISVFMSTYSQMQKTYFSTPV